jgi:RimJ/RimL family protein N-acetyltransferase
VNEGPIAATLRDGAPVIIRMVEPDDKPAFAQGMARLSTRSRYLRFHSGIKELSDKQLRYLTEVDQQDHVAWVAFTAEGDDDDVGIGVARFVRVSDEPDVAEAAITVLDEYQGRGLGTLLLGVLSASARQRGVRMFRSYVLGENASMLALFDALGAQRTMEEPGVYRVDMAVPQVPDDLADTAIGRIIHAVTGRRLPQMRTTAPPVWTSDDTERPMLRDWLDRALDHTVRPSRDRAPDGQ